MRLGMNTNHTLLVDLSVKKPTPSMAGWAYLSSYKLMLKHVTVIVAWLIHLLHRTPLVLLWSNKLKILFVILQQGCIFQSSRKICSNVGKLTDTLYSCWMIKQMFCKNTQEFMNSHNESMCRDSPFKEIVLCIHQTL